MEWALLNTDQEEWDAWIDGFDQADIYYRRSYAKLEETYHEKCYLLCCRGDGWKMAEVFRYRDVSTCDRLAGKIDPGTVYDIASMYGYGGPLLEGIPKDEELKAVWTEAAAQLKLNNYFVRFHPVLGNSSLASKIYHPISIGKSAVIPLQSEEEIWSQMTSTCRNRIRNGKKAGVKICSGRELWMKEAFVSLYRRSMERKRADSFYFFNEAYFDSLHNMGQEECIYFVAMYEEKAIAAAVILLGKKTMHYHLACSDEAYYHIPAANLIIYESSLWGLAHNFTAYHLGSGLGGSGKDSLMRFKKGFAPKNCHPFEIGHMVFEEEKYKMLNRLAGTQDEHYYPAYRAPKR